MKPCSYRRDIWCTGISALCFLLCFMYSPAAYAQVFQLSGSAVLPPTRYSAGVWGDYDNDGDLDVLISGDMEGDGSRVYRNDGGSLTNIGAGLAGVRSSCVAWGDYDNDGDLDIFLSGDSAGVLLSYIYRNDAGSFTNINAGLPGVRNGFAAWGDYDNDGDLDLVMGGDGGGSAMGRLYRNDAGSFTSVNIGLPGLSAGCAAWGDYDNDGDLDIVMTGYNNGPLSGIYRNDGGQFSDMGAGLLALSDGSVAWGDYDNDGDLDLLMSGRMNSTMFFSYVYRNDAGSFTNINAGLANVAFSAGKWGDYDNDGDLDILLTGFANISLSYSLVYRNDAGTFTDINAGPQGIRGSGGNSGSWGDFDNDGDLDFLLVGTAADNTGLSQIWINSTTATNTAPAAPTGLAAFNHDATTATLSWSRATDSQTPQLGLSYNILVGTTPTNVAVQSPMANITNGYRRIPALGNKQQKTSTVITGLTPGATYYWGVQAIDGAYRGSTFATGSFYVNISPQISTGQTVVSVLEDGVRRLTVSVSDADNSFSQLTVTATSSNQSLVPNSNIIQQGATGATTQFTVTPAANASGPVIITVRVTDAGGLSRSTTFSLTITSVNDAPVFSTGTNVSVNEDSGAYSSGFATGISDGDPETSQVLAFIVNTNNNALFAVQPSVSGTAGILSFTPAANASGTAVVSIYLSDNGGTANGGVSTSATQTFLITVNAVNDAPVFSTGANVVVNEESGNYNAVFATGIDDGDLETTQTLTFITNNNNNTLFSVQPSVSATTGVLSFTPAAGMNGTSIVSIYLSDDGGTTNGGVNTSATQVFSITVNAVNDPPVFSTGANVTVNEDSGVYSAAFATGIDDGDPETTQTLTFLTSNNNNVLFSVQPSVSTTGILSFTPATNSIGTAVVSIYLSDNGGTANGGVNTSATQTFVIVILSVNDAPLFSTGANIVVNEDHGGYNNPFATGIDDGDPELTQAMEFIASNDNPTLFAVQPFIHPSGFLSFMPVANTYGSAVITVYVQDDGGTANGGVSTSATQTFTITVNPVNDEPVFSTGANVVINEDSGAYNAVFATGMNDSDPETTQTLTFVVNNDNNALFSVQPSISSTNGNLLFTPTNNANGTAVVSMHLSDDGGTANGGIDRSATQIFIITVRSVNDIPVFSTRANVVINEDSGAYNVAFATGIDDGDTETTQTLTFVVDNDNNALFSVQPSISGTTGNLMFVPATSANGTAVVSVYLTDNGGTDNGGINTSATQTFVVTVHSVNDALSFSTTSNIAVLDEDGAQSYTNFLTSISTGPIDESAQTIQFVVSNDNPSLFDEQPAISSTGTLTFTPVHWAQGTTVVSVYAMDDGGTSNGGVNTSATQTFAITVDLSPVVQLRVISVTPVSAQSGETVEVVVESYTAVGTLRATTATTTLELQYDTTYLPVLSGSTQAALAVGASTATISVSFYSSSTATISTPIAVVDLNSVLLSTSSSMMVEHAVISALTAATNNAQVSLEWAAPAAMNVTGYVVYRGPSTDALVELATSASTSYVDNTVGNGTTYYYAVKSALGVLLSGMSQTVSVTVPLLAITSPNGGEMWLVGTTHEIVWNTVGTVATVAVEYSLDNGGSWIDLSGSTTNTGSYNWFIQNPSTTTALVRIYDEARPLVMDMSDAVFQIVPIAPVTSLTASALNNGARLDWYASTSSQVSTYEVYHGLTSGTLTLLATLPSTSSSYVHTGLTDGQGHYYALRTVVNGEQSAFSSEVTVIPNTLRILYPNGGEVVQPGTEQVLRWEYSGDISAMTVEYSTDNGNSWNQISQTVTRSENKPLQMFYQNWTVANIPTTTALVRVRSTYPTELDDQSDATFTISTLAPATNLVAMAGSTSIDLEWTASTAATVTGYRVLRGTTSASLTPIAELGFTTTYDDTSANACVPYYYAVQTLAGDAVSAYSNIVSSIIELPSAVSVASPNGAEVWQVGTTHLLEWNSTGCTVPLDVTLWYSTDNGSNWTIIATVPNTGSYWWLIPNTPGAEVLVRVEGDALVDQSDAVFTIAPIAAPTDVIATAGALSIDLEWSTSTSQNVSGYELWRGTTSGSLSLLATVSSSTTMHNDATATACTTYYYAVRTLVGGFTSVSSNETSATIVLPAALSVASPNGGEVWQAGITHILEWSSTGCTVPLDVTLWYSTDNGSSWTTIATVANTGSYSWLVPSTSSAEALVRIEGNTFVDQSDAVFTIAPIAAPTNFVAVAGSSVVDLSWTASTSQNISGYEVWRGTTSGSLSLLASVGSMTSNYSDNTAINCTTYYYAVRTLVGSYSSELSSEVSATPQSVSLLTVISPNGGEVWHGGQVQMLQWISTSCTVPSSVTLSYSTNNGSNWTTIATVANTSSYTWTVPNTPSAQALVRVSDDVTNDISDAVFTILPTPVPVVSVVEPNISTSFCTGSASATAVSIQLSDPIYAVTNLNVTVSSSNPSIVPTSAIVLQGDLTSTTTFLVTPNATTSGVSVLTFTASNGYASSSTTITFSSVVNIPPSVAISGSTSVCSGSEGVYSVATSSSASYQWTVSGGVITSGQNTNQISVQWGGSGSGSVGVVATSASLCTASSNLDIVIRAVPVASVTASGVMAFCPGGSVVLTASPAGMHYQWSNGSTAQSISVGEAGSYNVVVSNQYGCSTPSENVVVAVHPGVSVEAGASVSVCQGSDVRLSAVGTSAVGGLTYQWIPATGLNNATISDPIATPSMTTTYRIIARDANGCEAVDQLTITVFPATSTTVSSNATICMGGGTELEATGGVSYWWSPSAGLSSTNGSVVTASPTTTTTYTVVIRTAGGCEVSRLVTVTVAPVAIADAGSDVTLCGRSGVQLSASGGMSYEWSPVEGLSNPHIANPIANPVTTTTYTVVVRTAAGCESSDEIAVTVAPVKLHLRALLEGAYSGSGEMSTSLRTQDLVPINHPYSVAPFNYNGSELLSTTSSMIVDWVLVELRSGISSNTRVARRAALLLSDGSVVASDGAILEFSEVGAGSYYVVLYHRNHVGVMSSGAVSMGTDCGLNHDFSSGNTYEVFMTAQKEVGTGEWSLVSGDVNADGIVNATDRVMVRNESGLLGYLSTDISLDGIVNAFDRVLSRNNKFRASQILE